jgi:hypothetical protein
VFAGSVLPGCPAAPACTLAAALALFTLLLFGATVYMGKERRATRKLNVQPELRSISPCPHFPRE